MIDIWQDYFKQFIYRHNQGHPMILMKIQLIFRWNEKILDNFYLICSRSCFLSNDYIAISIQERKIKIIFRVYGQSFLLLSCTCRSYPSVRGETSYPGGPLHLISALTVICRLTRKVNNKIHCLQLLIKPVVFILSFCMWRIPWLV